MSEQMANQRLTRGDSHLTSSTHTREGGTVDLVEFALYAVVGALLGLALAVVGVGTG